MGNKIRFRPARDWVIFASPRIEKTDAGIQLLGDAQKAMSSNIVEVLACGPTCEMVKVGDTVLVHPESSALIIHIDDEEYACVNEFQIVGVIPKLV
jgi:co-chaperonin GroES (HSP10)